MPRDRAVDRVAQRLGVADVEHRGSTSHPRRLQPRVDVLESCRVDVGEHDLRAVLGHHLRIGEAEPARRAGDERDVTFDVEEIGLSSCGVRSPHHEGLAALEERADQRRRRAPARRTRAHARRRR